MLSMLRTMFRLLLLSLPGSLAWAEMTLNMTPGVTEVSHRLYSLHMIILSVCALIGAVVFGVMFYSIFAHRRSKGAKAHHFHESVLVEVAWTMVPLLILVAMAVPSTRALKRMHDTDEADMTIVVTGYQWKWKYEYLDHDGLSFFSNLATSQEEIKNQVKKSQWYLLDVDEPLVLPVGKKIRFLFTANDVIHAWWVPALGVKRDTIPHFINESWTRIDVPGTYRGQCAELCGVNHGYMPIVVEAKNEAEFQAWVDEKLDAARRQYELTQKAWSLSELMERGQRVYEKACVACHQANGQGLPPSFPALAGSSVVLDDRQGHIDVVLWGEAGTAMQAFSEQLDALDLAAVITYERNAWGNDTGDVVSPAEILQAQKSRGRE